MPGAAPVSRAPYVPPEDVAAGLAQYQAPPPPSPMSALSQMRVLWAQKDLLREELRKSIENMEAELAEARMLLEALK